jgi:hypothetical protein
MLHHADNLSTDHNLATRMTAYVDVAPTMNQPLTTYAKMKFNRMLSAMKAAKTHVSGL